MKSYLKYNGYPTWHNAFGDKHKVDGPAIIYYNVGEFYINGKLFCKEDFNSWVLRIKKMYNRLADYVHV